MCKYKTDLLHLLIFISSNTKHLLNYFINNKLNIHNNGNLAVCDKIFERVSNFKYLGSILNQTNEIREELKRRINLGNACFYSVKKLLGSDIV